MAILSVSGSPVGAGEPPTIDSLKWYTPDRDFKPVEPAPWVFEGIQKAFVGDFANPKTLPYIDELAAMGVTVIHLGGPEPYYPPKRKGGAYSTPAERRSCTPHLNGCAATGCASSSAFLLTHPLRSSSSTQSGGSSTSPNEKALDPSLDLTRPENVALRSMSLNTPYGNYLIENIAEMFQDYKVDGVSFDGNYHAAINYTPFDMELFRKETGREFPAKIDLADDHYKVYLLWADMKLENWYRKLHARLRQVNPEAAVYTWTTNAGRYGHFLTTPRVMSGANESAVRQPRPGVVAGRSQPGRERRARIWCRLRARLDRRTHRSQRALYHVAR